MAVKSYRVVKMAEKDPPRYCIHDEGSTGVGCILKEGHALPHEGFYGPEGDDQYSFMVRWPLMGMDKLRMDAILRSRGVPSD